MPTGVPTTPTRTVWKPKRRKRRTHTQGHRAAATGRRARPVVGVGCGCGQTAVTFSQATELDLAEVNPGGMLKGKQDVTASIFSGQAQTRNVQVTARLTCTIWRSRVPGFWTVCRQESLWWWPAETLAELRADCRPCRTLWCPCRTCNRDGQQMKLRWGEPLECLRALKEAVSGKLYSLFIHFQTPCLQLHGISLIGTTKPGFKTLLSNSHSNFMAAGLLKSTRMTGCLILQQQLC